TVRAKLSTNRSASEQMLAALTAKVDRIRAGLHDPYADHRDAALSDLLEEFRGQHLDRGNTEKQGLQVVSRCRSVFDDCDFIFLRDLDATAVDQHLAKRRRIKRKDGGIGPQTSNHIVTALKSFGNWLVK